MTAKPTSVRLTPAPLAARLAAFALDLAVGLGLALVAAALAWVWLLATSGGGARQPADGAIYAGLAIAALWLPCWAAITLLGWSRRGQSPGLAALALHLRDANGLPPSPLRALLRLLALSAATAPLLLAPLLLIGAAAAAVQGTLPLPLPAGVLVLVAIALAAADPLCWLLTGGRRALHDLAAGTCVTRAG